MDKEKAKFILGAYQAGLPAAEEDEEMSAALEAAHEDAELSEWLRKQMEFDERVSAAFREIGVPQSLRRNILEGMDLSVRRRAWWRRPAAYWSLGLGTAVAAALMALMVILPKEEGHQHPGGDAGIVGAETERFEPWQRHALSTLDAGFQLEVDRGRVPGLSKELITGWLMGRKLPVPDSVMAKLTDDQLVGCFTVRNLPGNKTSTVCFNSKEGPVIHIVSAEVPSVEEGSLVEYGAPQGKPTPGNFGELNTLSWREGDKAIMLVSHVPKENLMNVLR